MKTFTLFLLVFFSLALNSQSVDDWTWYNPPVFDRFVGGLELDANGNIWMTSGTQIIKYDGVNWLAFDVLDSGLPLANAYPRSMDVSLGNKIWISTRDRVLEYEIDIDQWTIHDPSNSAVNFNASNIKVVSPNNINWTTGSGLYEYDGTSWDRKNLSQFSLNMNHNSLREIEIDNNNHKWFTTSSSLCIDFPCFTPAGVIRLTDTDTTHFDGDNFGFPEARATYIDIDSNEDLVLAYTNNSTWLSNDFNENFYRTYSNDQWSDPTEIPFLGYIYDLELGSDDQIYILFKEFIAIEENGVWDVVPLDTSQITYSASLLLTPEDNIYIAGRHGNTGITYAGVLGYLPELNFRIRGKLYSDRNYNGILDTVDLPLANQFVQTVNQDRLSFSNNVGDYSLLFSEPNTYSIQGLLPQYHSFGIPIDGIHSVPLTLADPVSADQHIGFEPDTSVIDLSLEVTNLNGANPGFETCYMINVKNNAPRLTNGEVTINFDDLLTFVSSDQTPTAVNANQFTFDIAEMDWLEIKNINICFSLPPDGELIGDTLKHFGSVTPGSGIDFDLENNVDTLCQAITGPYDPNFIEVHPTGVAATGNIPLATSHLEYTIHFQNIGNDTARNVFITNPIDPDLDILTTSVIGFSHDYELSYFEEGNIFKWSFNDINLPDNSANQLGSNGFIKYRIELKNKVVNTTFTNNAEIFFDFNLPIVTNTTVNTLVETTVSKTTEATIKKCDFNVQVIENNLMLQFAEIDNYQINLYDMNGRPLQTSMIHHSAAVIPLGELPKAPFIVSASSKNCSGAGKIFINH